MGVGGIGGEGESKQRDGGREGIAREGWRGRGDQEGEGRVGRGMKRERIGLGERMEGWRGKGNGQGEKLKET